MKISVETKFDKGQKLFHERKDSLDKNASYIPIEIIRVCGINFNEHDEKTITYIIKDLVTGKHEGLNESVIVTPGELLQKYIEDKEDK